MSRKGKLPHKESKAIKEKYAEFLMWQVIFKLSDKGTKHEINALNWAREQGYSSFDDRSFYEKHKIGKNTLKRWRDNGDLWDIYESIVLDGEKPFLPATLLSLRVKHPDKWGIVVYPNLFKGLSRFEIGGFDNKPIKVEFDISNLKKTLGIE
jgi:hypothetical protein